MLPAGYELVACNMPSQVLAEPDGRIAISFMNGSGAEAPLVVKGRLGAADRRRGRSAKTGFGEELGVAVRGRNRAGASFGTSASGPRDCLLPAPAGDARLQPLSRLHGVASGSRQVFQRGSHRQQSLGPVGLCTRHGGETYIENHDRCRTCLRKN